MKSSVWLVATVEMIWSL